MGVDFFDGRGRKTRWVKGVMGSPPLSVGASPSRRRAAVELEGLSRNMTGCQEERDEAREFFRIHFGGKGLGGTLVLTCFGSKVFAQIGWHPSRDQKVHSNVLVAQLGSQGAGESMQSPFRRRVIRLTSPSGLSAQAPNKENMAVGILPKQGGQTSRKPMNPDQVDLQNRVPIVHAHPGQCLIPNMACRVD